MNQLGLSVEVPQRRTKSAVRRARVWMQAIVKLEAALRVRGIDAKRFGKLPTPEGVTDAWTVTRGGVAYRCLYQYTVMPPLSGYPFVGRVDVVYE